MKAEIRVLLVEEYEERAELRKLLNSAQFNLVGEAGFGTEAVTIASQLKPDVVVLSMEEPVARPLKSIETLIMSNPNLLIVVVSSLSDRENMRKAMHSGARDYLVHPLRAHDLHKAIVSLYDQKQVKTTKGELHEGDVISVFGVKGGIGKTSISVNLAAAIANLTKQRVGLVDLDLQLGDVAVALNFLPEHTIADAAENVSRLEAEMLQGLVWADPCGMRVLPAPLRPEEADSITPEQVHGIVGLMARTYDYVVADTPPLFSDTVGAILDRSTIVLLLTSQDIFSLRRTKVALELLKGWGFSEDKVKLVINYAYHVDGVMSGDIEQTLQYPIFWKVPNDPVVPASIKLGRPFVEAYQGSRVAKNVMELARIVCGLKKREASNGLMSLLRR